MYFQLDGQLRLTRMNQEQQRVVNVSKYKPPSVPNIFSREHVDLPDVGSLKMSQEIREYFENVVFRHHIGKTPKKEKVVIPRKHDLTLQNLEDLKELTKTLNISLNISSDGKFSLDLSQAMNMMPVPEDDADAVAQPIMEGFLKFDPPQAGYILALDFWDQQISGLRNLLSLQCWAAHLGENVRVVEPFVIQSKFGALPIDGEESQLTFGGLYNKSIWIKEAPKHSKAKLAELADWDTFIRTASQSVVLVTLVYTDSKAGDCPMDKLREHTHEFILANEMEVIQEVCINLKEVGLTTTSDFDDLVFGNTIDTDVTVIFSQWRGVLNKVGWRICLSDSPCAQGIGFSQFALHLQPNIGLIADANRFIRSYYPNRYIGLMIRIEKVITYSGKAVADSLDVVKKCLTKIMYAWSELRRVTKINSTFLSMDYGRYGSSIFSSQPFKPLLANLSVEAENITKTVLGWNATVESWEETLKRATTVENPAYIALMQTTVAVKSRCLILAGGGLFHEHALRLYKRRHLIKDRCYILINEHCSRTANIVPHTY